jgi:homocysteine S-methyltransferase
MGDEGARLDVAADGRTTDRLSKLRGRIARGEIAVMDGGTGTGLQEIGVPMDGEAWSGVANLTHLDAVRALHAAYLSAGADVLITNTFAAGPGPLGAAGYGERFEEANRNAVSAALDARSAAGREDVLIAGSMSRNVAHAFSGSGSGARDSTGDAIRRAYARQATILADAGVDVIALEMMGSRAHAGPALEASVATGLPVWLGISIVEASGNEATTIDGEDLAGLTASLPMSGVDAVFVMHTDIQLVPDSLSAIRGVWLGTVGAYPHVGDWTPPNWVFDEIAPSAFADQARAWVTRGATIVGGCCGIGPTHIAALAARVAARRG